MNDLPPRVLFVAVSIYVGAAAVIVAIRWFCG